VEAHTDLIGVLHHVVVRDDVPLGIPDEAGARAIGILIRRLAVVAEWEALQRKRGRLANLDVHHRGTDGAIDMDQRRLQCRDDVILRDGRRCCERPGSCRGNRGDRCRRPSDRALGAHCGTVSPDPGRRGDQQRCDDDDPCDGPLVLHVCLLTKPAFSVHPTV